MAAQPVGDLTMSLKEKAAPFKTPARPGAAPNICQDYNDKSSIKQWIKAGIGILFYKNLISFSTACHLSDFLGVRND